jgi:hypothetical protein
LFTLAFELQYSPVFVLLIPKASGLLRRSGGAVPPGPLMVKVPPLIEAYGEAGERLTNVAEYPLPETAASPVYVPAEGVWEGFWNTPKVLLSAEYLTWASSTAEVLVNPQILSVVPGPESFTRARLLRP